MRKIFLCVFAFTFLAVGGTHFAGNGYTKQLAILYTNNINGEIDPCRT